MILDNFKEILYLPLILISFLILKSFPGQAQETNYWSNQIGASSSLLGGAVTSGTRDNSAVFYNPGALGHIENPSISGNGDAYYYRWLTIENGAGANLDLNSNQLNSVPLFFSGIVKSKKNPDLIVNYAVLNKQIIDYRLFANNEMDYDVIESRPGLENYHGTYDYLNITREDWLGVGIGQVLGKSKNVGIGASFFVSYSKQDFSNRFIATTSEVVNGLKNTLAFVNAETNMTYASSAIIAKGGASFDFEKWKFGFTITPPLLNINFVGKGSLFRSISAFIPSQLNNAPSFSVSREKLNTVRKTPWVFDFGASFEWGENNLVGLRATLFTRIEPYDLLEEWTQPDPIDPSLDLSGFGNIQTAGKPVVNVGVGLVHKIVPGLALLSGIHTNFNYYDQSALPREDNFVNSIDYWNMWHYSAGIIWYREKYDINFGAVFANGGSSGDLQQINLSDPKDYRLLQGERDYSTVTRMGQFMIVLGFSYKFTKI